MTTKQQEKYRPRLKKRLLELEGPGSAALKDLKGEKLAEDAETAMNMQYVEAAAGRQTQNSADQNAAEEALNRINAGTFGSCIECEGLITPRRLNALPWAPLCAQCQTELEARLKGQSYEAA